MFLIFKKRLLNLLLGACCAIQSLTLLSQSNGNFSLKVIIENPISSTIQLVSIDTSFYKIEASSVNSHIDTVYFKGTLQLIHPFFLYIESSNGDSGRTEKFYLDTGTSICRIVLINFIGRSPEVNSSRTQLKYQNFKSKYLNEPESNFSNCISDLNTTKKGSLNTNKITNAIHNCKKDRNLAISTQLKKYSKDNPDTIICLWEILHQIKNYGYNRNYEIAIANLHTNDMKIEPLWTLVNNRLNQTKIGNLESTINNASVLNSKRNPIKLANIRSKYILLDFWFLKCGPCVDNFRYLNKYYEKWKLQGLEIVSINIDNYFDYTKSNSLLNNMKIFWNNYWDVDKSLITALGIIKFPTTFLLNEERKIVVIDPSINEIEQLLIFKYVPKL